MLSTTRPPTSIRAASSSWRSCRLPATNKVDRKALGLIARERWSPSARLSGIRDDAMKAAVIYEHGGPGSIRYENRVSRSEAGRGEVLVRVKRRL